MNKMASHGGDPWVQRKESHFTARPAHTTQPVDRYFPNDPEHIAIAESIYNSPRECSYCLSVFTSRFDLNRHMDEKHNGRRVVEGKGRYEFENQDENRRRGQISISQRDKSVDSYKARSRATNIGMGNDRRRIKRSEEVETDLELSRSSTGIGRARGKDPLPLKTSSTRGYARYQADLPNIGQVPNRWHQQLRQREPEKTPFMGYASGNVDSDSDLDSDGDSDSDLGSGMESEVKLNDLNKSAENFKIDTPIPTDLDSIIAKDKGRRTVQQTAHSTPDQTRSITNRFPRMNKDQYMSSIFPCQMQPASFNFICLTISRDSTLGEDSRKAELLAGFGKRLQRRSDSIKSTTFESGDDSSQGLEGAARNLIGVMKADAEEDSREDTGFENGNSDIHNVENDAGQFTNKDYIQAAHNILTGTFDHAQAAADYVMRVAEARQLRELRGRK